MNRLRLNLRDFFWLTLTVTLSLGWWLDRTPLARDLSSMRQSNEELGEQATLARGELLVVRGQYTRFLELCQDRGMELDFDDAVWVLGKEFSARAEH